MADESSRRLLRQINALFQCGLPGSLSDEELLREFVAGCDESAESAFSAWSTGMARHGAGRLSPRARQPARGRRCVPGHVSGPVAQGFSNIKAGTAGKLASWRRTSRRGVGCKGASCPSADLRETAEASNHRRKRLTISSRVSSGQSLMKSLDGCMSAIGLQLSSASSKACHAEKPRAGLGFPKELSRADWLEQRHG